MKKAITILLALLMLLSLMACGGSKSSVQDALQGSWVAKWTAMGKSISRYYTFKGDKYTTGGTALLGELETKTGKIQIKKTTIHCIPDDGSEPNDLDYVYNEKTGEITLWWNDDVQFQKGKVNVNY